MGLCLQAPAPLLWQSQERRVVVADLSLPCQMASALGPPQDPGLELCQETQVSMV